MSLFVNMIEGGVGGGNWGINKGGRFFFGVFWGFWVSKGDNVRYSV